MTRARLPPLGALARCVDIVLCWKQSLLRAHSVIHVCHGAHVHAVMVLMCSCPRCRGTQCSCRSVFMSWCSVFARCPLMSWCSVFMSTLSCHGAHVMVVSVMVLISLPLSWYTVSCTFFMFMSTLSCAQCWQLVMFQCSSPRCSCSVSCSVTCEFVMLRMCSV